MPLKTRYTGKGEPPAAGYEMVWMNGQERWDWTHYLADLYNLSILKYTSRSGGVRHHVDWNKRNNDPANIRRMDWREHLELHRETTRILWQNPEHRRHMSERAKAQWEDPAYQAYMQECARQQRQDPEMNQKVLDGFRQWYSDLSETEHEEYCQWQDPEFARRHSEDIKAWWREHPEHREKTVAGLKRCWDDPEYRARRQAGQERWFAANPPEERGRIIREGHRRKALTLLNSVLDAADVRQAYENLRHGQASTALSYDRLLQEHFAGDEAQMHEVARNINCKVVAVRHLEERGDVYDITVEGYENFGLAAGVFVHNSAKQARDRRFQAILPLRGKIINVEKARLDKILDNAEIRALITAIGTNIGEQFELDNLRYHRVLLLSDADVDGAHIRTLLLTFFFRYMQPLIEHGHLYFAQPPLYRITDGKKEVWLYTEEEKDKYMAQVPEGKKVTIQRYKGLGEMNPEQLWATTLNPEHRVLYQVTMEDIVEAEESFSVLMGNEVAPRRRFIQTHAASVKNLDV